MRPVLLDKAVWHNFYTAMPNALITHEAEMYTLIDKSSHVIQMQSGRCTIGKTLQFVQAVNTLPESYTGAIGSPIQILAVFPAMPATLFESAIGQQENRMTANSPAGSGLARPAAKGNHEMFYVACAHSPMLLSSLPGRLGRMH